MKAELHEGAIGGRQIYWRNWPRPGARPALALHCTLSHGGEWVALAAGRRELEVTAPDLTGHGRMPDWQLSPDPHGESTAIARIVAERIGGGAPVDVIGHSFGGTVALRLALEHPGMIRRLVLVEPVLFAAARKSLVWPTFEAEHREVEALYMAGDAEAALTRFLEIWGTGEPPDETPEKLWQYMIARIGMVMRTDAYFTADAAGLLVPGRLEGFERPVLLVEGSDSPDVVAAIHDHLAGRLPNAQRQVIGGAGHLLPITHGVAFAQSLGPFMAD